MQSKSSAPSQGQDAQPSSNVSASRVGNAHPTTYSVEHFGSPYMLNISYIPGSTRPMWAIAITLHTAAIVASIFSF
jgi:hypothetical protein